MQTRDIRKVVSLLGDFEKARCRVYYFAQDMNAEKLEESMRRIPSTWPKSWRSGKLSRRLQVIPSTRVRVSDGYTS